MEGASATGSAPSLSVAAEYSPLVFSENCCTSVGECCTTVGCFCAALASPDAKTKAPKDKPSTTKRARLFWLRRSRWRVILCECARYKSLCVSYLSLILDPPP